MSSGGLRLARPWPLSCYLLAMMLALIIPAVFIAGFLLAESSDQQQERIRRDALSRAEALALSLDGVTVGLVSALKALSTSPALTADTISQFQKQAAATFAGLDVDVIVRDRELRVLGPPLDRNSAPLDRAVRDSDRIFALEALNSSSPQFSNFDADVRGGVPGVSLWLGANTESGRKLLVQARLTSEFLSRQLAVSADDPLWSAAVSDANETFIARSNNATFFLGKERSKETQQKSAGKSGVIETTNIQGTKTLHAYTFSNATGWRVSLAAPLDKVFEEARVTWNRFLIGSAGFAALAIGIASYLGQMISRSVGAVTDNARKLLLGEPHTEVIGSIREVSDLTLTLTETVDELTRRKLALLETDNRLRMALDVGGMGIWEWDRENDTMRWDAAQLNIMGKPEGGQKPTGRDFMLRVYPDDRSDIEAAINDLSNVQPRLAREFRVFRHDGALRWVAVRASFLQDDDASQRIVGVMYDITAEKTRVEQTGTLLREISHRSKNMLAVILAMARLTARGASDVKTHLREFSLRIAGLSASQDLIVESSWSGVRLADLVRAEAKSIAHDRSDRVRVTGPDVKLAPEATQTLGMAFTELTLNAMEHGALASAAGIVEVSWAVSDADDLTITWIETGGPASVNEPVRGYGLSVVENLAGRSLGAASSVVFSDSGVRWTLNCPLRNVTASPANAVAI